LLKGTIMLNLTRHAGESLLFEVMGEQPVRITLTLLELPPTPKGQARFGIDAPQEVRIHRLGRDLNAASVSSALTPPHPQAVTLLPLDGLLRFCEAPRSGWQWTLWEAVRVPDRTRMPVLRTTVFLASQPEQSSAACDRFEDGHWQEVLSLGNEQLHLVSLFANQPIAQLSQSALQTQWIQMAVRQDQQRVRTAALASLGLVEEEKRGRQRRW
jgi:sRNA-binding carbon storage regulator CsrA